VIEGEGRENKNKKLGVKRGGEGAERSPEGRGMGGRSSPSGAARLQAGSPCFLIISSFSMNES